ncbi:MAG: pyruvate kinase alpha/beta domain-containing protein [Desulfobacterales bacterium]|jgi:hypothetical protein
MSKGTAKKVFYFDKKGPENTDKTLDIALEACKEWNIQKIIVASSTGNTALKLHAKATSSLEIIAVTYGAGSSYTADVDQFNKNYDTLVETGIRTVRGIHALSATERAFENKYNSGFTPLNLVADTLRMFCHGVKVCVEIAIMAAEGGFVTTDEEIVAIAGSHHGADTAVVLKPAFAAKMFETKIKALLCMPA